MINNNDHGVDSDDYILYKYGTIPDFDLLEKSEQTSVAVDFDAPVVVARCCWPEVLLVVVLHVATGPPTVVDVVTVVAHVP